MLIQELPIPDFLKHNLLELGISKLYPPQAEAIEAGALSGENLVLATPTASGKTLVALLAASRHLEMGGKVLYLVPLRALASEKLSDVRETLCKGSRFRAAASTGDYDSSDPWLANYDVIIATNEKADSLLRHRAEWIDDVTLIVLDELHVLGDPDRGPTLEMVATRLRRRLPRAQILGLSATISNAWELAEWIGGKMVSSDWRPVPLREGVLMGNRVEFADGEVAELPVMDRNVIVNAVLNTVAEGGQALVFASTRRRAEQYAVKLAQAFSRRLGFLGEEERERLESYAGELLAEERSAFTETLAELVAAGAAFHHAGLSYTQRRIIEEAFRSRVLKAVAATPTLAAGVNLPARLVLVTEIRRYSVGQGYYPIPILEYKQFCGRAGRPGYDRVGYALTIARRRDEKEYIMDKYVRGEPERISSKLASERHLRMHVLALIATGEAGSVGEVMRFFDETLLSHVYGSRVIENLVWEALGFLSSAGFLKPAGERIEATRLGRRVAQLYIDPLTALTLLEIFERGAAKPSSFGLIHALALTPDVPTIPMKRLGRGLLEEELSRRLPGMMLPPPEPDEDYYEDYFKAFRTALVLEAWIEEVPEAELYERYGVQPGDLAALRERASWIAYAASQIAKIAGYGAYVASYELLSERLRHGVREELLPLVRLRGIGRVRARALYRSGYTSLEKLRAAPVEELMRIAGIGPKLAERIKESL